MRRYHRPSGLGYSNKYSDDLYRVSEVRRVYSDDTDPSEAGLITADEQSGRCTISSGTGSCFRSWMRTAG